MDKCPITGLPCDHKKSIHVTEVVNYQAVESKDMCALCGLQYITTEGGPAFDPTANQVFQIINSVIKDSGMQEGKIVLGPFQPPKIECPSCGHTPEDIMASGKIGCSKCYEYYKKDLLPLIEKCQTGATKHVGKVPKNLHPESLSKLENELKAAITKEDYEKAAALRDEIKKLQSGK